MFVIILILFSSCALGFDNFLEISANGSQGNEQKSLLSLGLKNKINHDNFDFHTKIEASRYRFKSKTVDNIYYGKILAEYNITQSDAWYTRISIFNSKTGKIRGEGRYGIGYVRRFYQLTHYKTQARIGLERQKLKYPINREANSYVLIGFMLKDVREYFTFDGELNYRLDITDNRFYYIDTILGLSVRANKYIDFAIEYHWSYNKLSNKDLSSTNNKYITKLIYKF